MKENKILMFLMGLTLSILMAGCANESSPNVNLSPMHSTSEATSEATSEPKQSVVVSANEDILITSGGVYEVKGSYEEVSIIVDAMETDAVEIVLNDVNIINTSKPAIYVKNAEAVTLTVNGSNGYLGTTSEFKTDGETNLDAVVFSKSDLILAGNGTLKIVSTKGHAFVSKENLTIQGGTYMVEAASDGFQSDETLTVSAGTINIISCSEGLESTQVYINGGDININASDDGINASQKSDRDMMIEINGGNLNIQMAAGDTDALDSNGTLTINGGTLNISAMSAFDSDGPAVLNGGDITVNGEKVTEITQMQMGPGSRQPGMMKRP